MTAQSSPPALRNREPILQVLRRVFPARGLVLGIAEGTGEHVVHFAAGLPNLTWQPSDSSAEARASIAAHRAAAGLQNVLAPIDLDVRWPAWPVERADAIHAINMIHIAPWAACEGLMAGAERTLSPGGVLFLYGPYKENGVHTAPSNAAFDDSLRSRNAEWGIRDLGDVKALAGRHALEFVERVAMPANNLSVVFRRQ